MTTDALAPIRSMLDAMFPDDASAGSTDLPAPTELLTVAVEIMAHVAPEQRHAEVDYLAGEAVPGMFYGNELPVARRYFWSLAAIIAALDDCLAAANSAGRRSVARQARAQRNAAVADALALIHKVPLLTAFLPWAASNNQASAQTETPPGTAVRGSETNTPEGGTSAGTDGTGCETPARFAHRPRSRK